MRENSGLDLAKVYMGKFPNIKILIITSFADYDMSHGDAFIIWLLMAILIKQSLFNK